MFNHTHHHHHYYHDDTGKEVLSGLVALRKALDLANGRLEKIMATMEELNAAVARNTDAEDSVIALLSGISQQLKDARAANDPAAIDAVIAKIDANTAKSAAAVVANT